jgi:hypothetical protein
MKKPEPIQAEVVSETAVAVRESSAMAVRDPESILRYAVDKGASVETIERLMAVRRELQGERAKGAFDEALAAFQAECPVIEKRKSVMNKDGRSVRYKYAPLDDIVAQVKGLLQRHGFSYTLNAEVDKNCVKAICKITHREGHSQESSFQVPIDPTAFMSEAQKFAASLTFAKRYAFCNSFGILTGDEDTDGRVQKEKPQGPARATEKTRDWFIQQIATAGITQQALGFAIDHGWLEPDEPITSWPLEHVPTSAPAAQVMLSEIKEYAE